MFELFSIPHYAALFAMVIILASIAIWRRKLRDPIIGSRFRITLAILLLACEISLQLSYSFDGGWRVGSLPFQLCSFTLLLSAVLLVFKRTKLYSTVFFLGSLGAIQAMLTPNLDQAFPHFRYFHFFTAHIGILATAMFLLVVECYRPTLKSMFGAYIGLHLIALPAATVNYLSGTTNFMFLARKPSTASMLDFLSPWPWYLFQLELVVVSLCLLLLFTVHFVYWIHGKLGYRTNY